VNAQCAREVLSDDGFGAAIWAAADRGDITPEQAPLIVRSLLTAGVDTTVHGLGAVLRGMATDPGAWAALRARLAARVERIGPTAEPTRHLDNTMRAFASQPLALHRAAR
jgi:cytochrome P450